MNRNLESKLHPVALAVVLALGTATAYAAAPDSESKEAVTQPNVLLAQATPTPATPAAAPAVDPAAGKNPLQAGAWRAAAQGIEPLRRYLWRTRMIYNFYIGDFVVKE